MENNGQTQPVPQPSTPPSTDLINPGHQPAAPATGQNPVKDQPAAAERISAQLKRAEIWMICLTALIVIVGGLQWDTMRGQLAQMKGSSAQTDRLIIETHNLAGAAEAQARASMAISNSAETQTRSAQQLATAAAKQADAAIALANVTNEQNGILGRQLTAIQEGQILQQRPWVNVSNHRIVSPLTFDWEGKLIGTPVAQITMEYTLENVGQSVAVDVVSWEDVIPMDLDSSLRTAQARQREWCDAHRHPDPREPFGITLFPHNPSIQGAIVGPTMDKVVKATIHDKSGLNGMVRGFVLVGCVCYRSSFEPSSSPTHRTRFTYFLGIPHADGGLETVVVPQGVAADLRLVAVQFTAD